MQLAGVKRQSWQADTAPDTPSDLGHSAVLSHWSTQSQGTP